MTAINTRSEHNLNSISDLQNRSYDGELDTFVYQPLGFDGQNLQRMVTDALATKIVVAGSITYVAQAAPGTSQSDAKWRVKKIDESTAGTTIITWAGGTSNFAYVATDLSSLSYS